MQTYLLEVWSCLPKDWKKIVGGVDAFEVYFKQLFFIALFSLHYTWFKPSKWFEEMEEPILLWSVDALNQSLLLKIDFGQTQNT